MKEVWRPVPYEEFDKKYLVSNHGRVRPRVKSKYSTLKGRHLRPGVGARGYAFVCLYANGATKQASIHRMVATVFVSRTNSDQKLVCHLDDDKLNNRSDNLVWGTPRDNMRMMVEHGRSLAGTKNPKARLSDMQVFEIRSKYKSGATQMSLAALYGVHQTQISRIVRRDHWSHTS